MIKKNEELELNITGLNSEGQGIARTEEGFVIFCPNTLPGDTVNAVIKKKKSSYAEARLVSLITPSPFRIEPKCRHFGLCGGCKVQNYSYDKQIDFKTETVRNALEKIGGFTGLDIPPAVKSTEEYYYRNKMEFSFSDEKWLTDEDMDRERGKFALGLHIPKFHTKILDIEECFLQSKISADIVNFSREFFINFCSRRSRQEFLGSSEMIFKKHFKMIVKFCTLFRSHRCGFNQSIRHSRHG